MPCSISHPHSILIMKAITFGVHHVLQEGTLHFPQAGEDKPVLLIQIHSKQLKKIRTSAAILLFRGKHKLTFYAQITLFGCCILRI